MITELARAKVNLTLEVLGRRADGYHEIASLVAFADIGDEVTIDPCGPTGVVVSGQFGAAISGENLIAVALRKLAAAEPTLRLGRIALSKRLPVAAGIGGGSSDAAAVLRAVRDANPEYASRVDWQSVARDLGADVPVCLADRTSWMTGIGETLTPLPGWPTLGAVLINPLIATPVDKTAQVFRRFDARALAGFRAAPGPPSSGEHVVDFLARSGNALEPAAIAVMPIVAAVKAALLATPGCRYAAVSGGGPTCFGIFDYPAEAAARLAADEPGWWVRPVVLGDGPVRV